MNIAIASDHAGIEMKAAIVAHLKKVTDCGPTTSDSVDYPDYAQKVVDQLKNKIANMGILICGTGIGMSIAANRYPFVRAGLCRTVSDAEMTRCHNDANVLCLGARTTSVEEAIKIVDAFLKTPFDTAERHTRRRDKLSTCGC